VREPDNAKHGVSNTSPLSLSKKVAIEQAGLQQQTAEHRAAILGRGYEEG